MGPAFLIIGREDVNRIAHLGTTLRSHFGVLAFDVQYNRRAWPCQQGRDDNPDTLAAAWRGDKQRVAILVARAANVQAAEEVGIAS